MRDDRTSIYDFPQVFHLEIKPLSHRRLCRLFLSGNLRRPLMTPREMSVPSLLVIGTISSATLTTLLCIAPHDCWSLSATHTRLNFADSVCLLFPRSSSREKLQTHEVFLRFIEAPAENITTGHQRDTYSHAYPNKLQCSTSSRLVSSRNKLNCPCLTQFPTQTTRDSCKIHGQTL